MRWWILSALVACTGGGTDGLGSIPTEASGTPSGIDAGPWLRELPQMWRGPASVSPWGTSFLTMDLAPTAPGQLFGRADASEGALRLLVVNDSEGPALRVAWSSPSASGEIAAVLHDESGGTWQFCAEAGCGAGSITVRIEDQPELVLHLGIEQGGKTVLDWSPYGLADTAPYEAGVARLDWPVLPTVNATLSWVQPTTTPANAVWVVSRTRCQTGCVASRVSVLEAKVGSTSSPATMPELHPGNYFMTAFLDRNRNATAVSSWQPDAGDLVAIPADREEVVVGDVSLSFSASGEL